jgi:hypothetical protein
MVFLFSDTLLVMTSLFVATAKGWYVFLSPKNLGKEHFQSGCV